MLAKSSRADRRSRGAVRVSLQEARFKMMYRDEKSSAGSRSGNSRDMDAITARL